MKRPLKISLRILLAFFLLSCVNLGYYVLIGQKSSSVKLSKGEELSLYECMSIYQMHIAVWSLGWPLSPEAARECFMLHLPIRKDTVIVRGKIDSPKIRKAASSLKHDGQSVYVAWNGARDYALRSPEHRAAIAVNPCYVKRVGNMKENGNGHAENNDENSSGILFEITSSMQYPKWSETVFNLGFCSITAQEGLFRYLQDKGWLSCFVAKYYLTVDS